MKVCLYQGSQIQVSHHPEHVFHKAEAKRENISSFNCEPLNLGGISSYKANLDSALRKRLNLPFSLTYISSWQKVIAKLFNKQWLYNL